MRLSWKEFDYLLKLELDKNYYTVSCCQTTTARTYASAIQEIEVNFRGFFNKHVPSSNR